MRRFAAFAMLFLFAISVLWAGGAKENSISVPADEPIVMKIGHVQPVTHPRHESLLKFKELVGQRTNGGIEVEVFPAGQLGDEQALLNAVKLGILQGTRCGLFESVSPKFLIYTMPFLFDSLDSVEKVTMGPIGDRIAETAEGNGLLVLATGDAGGFRQITNSVRPITRPDDLKGLRMRAPEVKTTIRTLEAFGASVVSVPYGDTYGALKSGFCEGQENPFINIESMKFYEVQKYLTIIDYQFHPDPFVVNPEWFRALPPQYQRILKDCAVESMRYNNRLTKLAAAKAFETMANALDVTVLTPAQRQAFKETADAVYSAFISEGLMTRAELEEIRAAAR